MLLKCETLAISRGLYLSMEMHATPRKARKVGIKRTNTTELQFLQVVRYQVQRKKEECFRFLPYQNSCIFKLILNCFERILTI